MWLSPLVFCFGYMPGLLLICYLLPSISDTKQPAHAGLTITKYVLDLLVTTLVGYMGAPLPIGIVWVSGLSFSILFS